MVLGGRLAIAASMTRISSSGLVTTSAGPAISGSSKILALS